MTTILIDRLASVVLHNGILRVDCIAAGPDGEERPSGTLLIPGQQAGPIFQALIGATQELDRRAREKALTESATSDGPPN